MKKQLLFALATVYALGSYAQTSIPDMNGVKIAKPFTKQMITGFENGPATKGPGSGGNSISSSANGTVIGGTTYDLQSNSAVQNRLLKFSDGTMSAVWTFSNTYNIAAPDRGTGYNYYNGTTWGPAPTARVESSRGGWPSILDVNGGEFNSLHSSTGPVTTSKRIAKGTGTWTQSSIAVSGGAHDLIWNRTAVGGTNGQTIHMVAVTAPVANGGTLYQGIDGALVYFRSLDGGVTWDQQAVILPGMTSAEFIGFGGDSYSMTAKGNTIVLAVYNSWADSFIMKSTDNGTTWTKTLFVDFPMDLYVTDQPGGSDANGDGIIDTLSTTDNCGSVVIDNNGLVHVFYGNSNVLDADLTDGNTSYFPYTNGLLYWNENMPADSGQFIAWAEDFDNDGSVINGTETDIALYFASLASYPNASIDANGAIYVTYSAYMENLSNGAQSYRHVYIVKSDDGGCTWDEFQDVTPNDNFAECMFASIANVTDDSIRFIYQEDIEPGLAVRGDEDAYSDNSIVYVSLHKSSLSSTPLNCITWVTGDLEFCFGDTVTLNANCGTGYSWSTGATTASIDVTTFGALSVDISTSCGVTNTHNVVTLSPSSAPVIIPTGANFICGSTPITIGVAPVSLGSYIWSNLDTTASITVSAAGSYSVTVSNCGGMSTHTITIMAEPSPSDVVNVIGQTTICEGTEIVVLSALEGSTWLWSNGETTQSITISTVAQTGMYTCEITNSCGDMVTSSSVNITVNPQPVQPSVTYSGNGVYTSSEAQGNQWYVDGSSVNGATSQTFNASAYLNSIVTVVVTNSEGCSSDASTDQVVGVSEIKTTLNNVSLFPNPSNGVFEIKFSNATAGIYDIKITNVIGQVMVTKSVNVSGSLNETMDLTNFNNGLYFVTISNNGEENVYKLIVE